VGAGDIKFLRKIVEKRVTFGGEEFSGEKKNSLCCAEEPLGKGKIHQEKK